MQNKQLKRKWDMSSGISLFCWRREEVVDKSKRRRSPTCQKKGTSHFSLLARTSDNAERSHTQRRGFAPLAARPAPTLSTSSFAYQLYSYSSPQGKAFYYRKTAPTLESSSMVTKTKKDIPQWYILFCWRREEDSNLRTSFPSHTISNRAP